MSRTGKTKVIVSCVLALTVMVSVLFSSSNAAIKTQKSQTLKQSAVTDTSKKAQVNPVEERKLVVYYLHGNARCQTCFKLESFAKSEIETNFSEAITKGALEWKTINVEDKGNEHFTNDYKLYTKAIIVSTRQGDKEESWKNLDQIWQLVHEEGKYREYIKKEVAACLDGKCL